jgi:hypothetical protein
VIGSNVGKSSSSLLIPLPSLLCFFQMMLLACDALNAGFCRSVIGQLLPSKKNQHPSTQMIGSLWLLQRLIRSWVDSRMRFMQALLLEIQTRRCFPAPGLADPTDAKRSDLGPITQLSGRTSRSLLTQKVLLFSLPEVIIIQRRVAFCPAAGNNKNTSQLSCAAEQNTNRACWRAFCSTGDSAHTKG